jgi:hypothetical protein
MYEKLRIRQRAYVVPPRTRSIPTANIRQVPKSVVQRSIAQPKSKPNVNQLKVLVRAPLQIPQANKATVVRPKRNIISSKANKPITKTRNVNISDQTRIQQLKGVGRNKVLVMIAAGPSVNEVDFTPLKDNQSVDFMCINKPYKPLWPTKYWVFCDHTQFVRNEKEWNEYSGIIINSPNVTARRGNQIVLKTRHGKGFSQDIAHGYYIGRSSTYANLQVALYMGYDQIYIFGIDMTEVNGQLHHYGANPDVSPDNRKKRFAVEAEHYAHAGILLPQEVRRRFIFCSSYNPWSFLQYFERLDHKVAVSHIKLMVEAKQQALLLLPR